MASARNRVPAFVLPTCAVRSGISDFSDGFRACQKPANIDVFMVAGGLGFEPRLTESESTYPVATSWTHVVGAGV
jgi:hypothetical protein